MTQKPDHTVTLGETHERVPVRGRVKSVSQIGRALGRARPRDRGAQGCKRLTDKAVEILAHEDRPGSQSGQTRVARAQAPL